MRVQVEGRDALKFVGADRLLEPIAESPAQHATRKRRPRRSSTGLESIEEGLGRHANIEHVDDLHKRMVPRILSMLERVVQIRGKELRAHLVHQPRRVVRELRVAAAQMIDAFGAA